MRGCRPPGGLWALFLGKTPCPLEHAEEGSVSMRMPREHPVEGDGHTCRHLEAHRPGTLHLGAPGRVGRRRSRRNHRRQPSGHRRLLRLPYRIYAPRRINSRLEAAAFAARAIDAEDVSWEQGLPLTRPERTLIDLRLDSEDPSLIADAYLDARDIGLDYERLGRLSSPWRGWPTSPCAIRTMLGASRGTSPRETWPSSTPKSPRPLQAEEGVPRSGSGQEDDHGEPRPCRPSGRGLG